MKDITTEEAIEDLKKLTTTKFNNDYSIDSKDKASIEKVLNELESLQFKYRARAERLNTKLEKKDKIIDAMVKFIDTELSSEHLTRVLKKEVLPLKTYREEIKQYFERKVEDE